MYLLEPLRGESLEVGNAPLVIMLFARVGVPICLLTIAMGITLLLL